MRGRLTVLSLCLLALSNHALAEKDICKVFCVEDEKHCIAGDIKKTGAAYAVAIAASAFAGKSNGNMGSPSDKLQKEKCQAEKKSCEKQCADEDELAKPPTLTQ